MFTASRIVPGTIAILALTALAGVARADRTFQTGGWAAANWETVQYGAGTVTGVRDGSGGNPDAAWQVTTTVSPSGGPLAGYQRFRGTNLYDPAVDGAVTTIHFSIEGRWISSSISNSGHAVCLAIRQDGIDYAAFPTTPTGFTGNWVTISVTGMTASDFERMDGLPGTPDFSPSGAPFAYGFQTLVFGTTPNNSNVVNYDNLSMTVYSVPAPGAVALAGLGGLVAARRRRSA
ncbi:MAG: hypothetical protein GIKADHBN_00566 [Phycisphaerales bacterium]|nr:hypothetical protein [Phycisphaerales bacterium]